MLKMAQASKSDRRGSHPVALIGSLFLVYIKVDGYFRIGHLDRAGMDDISS